MLDKIITIIIVTVVLLAIEYGSYFLMKKFIKPTYNQGHFEDAHIYGLAIIAVIDLMIWYGDEVWS